MSKPCEHPEYWKDRPDGAFGPPGIDGASMEPITVLNSNVVAQDSEVQSWLTLPPVPRPPSMFVEADAPRSLLSVDEAVRRYRDAAREAQAANEAQRIAWEAEYIAQRRACQAKARMEAAAEDLRRAITEAPA